MTRLAYDTDLTDAQWEILKPLIAEAKPGGHPRTLNMPEVLNAIFTCSPMALNGEPCPYRRLSKDYEFLSTPSEMMLFAAMVLLMVHRLEPKTHTG